MLTRMGRPMSSLQSDIAQTHQDRRIQIQHAAQGRAMQLWQSASTQNLDQSWSVLGPQMVAGVVEAQKASAALATPYMDAMDASYGRDATDFTLAPESFTGVMLDGRQLGPAMFTAVTTTKTGIRSGMSVPQAFQAGMTALGVVVGAAVQDMGRSADMALMGARTYTRYVRVCSGKACSRCAILAGMSSSADAFQRHVCCQCTAAPIEVRYSRGVDVTKVPSGFFTSPEEYFASLSKREQDHRFTVAGADAIRHGASPVSVVNARRGANGIGYGTHTPGEGPLHTGRKLTPGVIGTKPDGTPLKVFYTIEGTSRYGSYGRYEARRLGAQAAFGNGKRTVAVRMMPEQIRIMAGSDNNRFRELLMRYGYGYATPEQGY